MGTARRRPQSWRDGREPRRRGSARKKSAWCHGTHRETRGLFPAPGFCDEELIFFRVVGLAVAPDASTHKPDDDEDIHVETFTIEEAKAMAARGTIVDLKTAYGLTLI